jgi:ATP synthase protein I
MQNGSDDADMKARLAKLASQLQAKREAETADERRRSEADTSNKSLGRAMSLGFRVLTEFVAATVVGALIGWFLDKWLGTTPWLLILFLGLGIAAGFNNVYRMSAPPARRDGDTPPQ